MVISRRELLSIEPLKGTVRNKERKGFVDSRRRYIDMGDFYPTGSLDLPTKQARLIEPYYNDTSAILAAVLLGILPLQQFEKEISEFIRNRNERETQPVSNSSRRAFLKYSSIFAALVAAGGIPLLGRKIAEMLHTKDARLYYAFSNFPLQTYLIRQYISATDFRSREVNDVLLALMPQHTEVVMGTNGKPLCDTHYFRISPSEGINYPRNYLLTVCELRQGVFRPFVHPDPYVVAGRADLMHDVLDTQVLAYANATVPQTLGMGSYVEQADRSEPVDAYVNPVVYGSSSLFIPHDIDFGSVIWDHAHAKIVVPHPYFSELNFRRGDDCHNAVGFLHDGGIRLVSQDELLHTIDKRVLDPSLYAVMLNQFCFDPSLKKGISPEFGFSANVHRNGNILLVTDDGRQMILSSSLDYYLRNKDYLSLIQQVEQYLGVSFVVACCLDLGLAGGFTIKDVNGTITKPVEPSYHDEDGNLSMGMLHTSSILLAQTNL